MFGVVAVRSAVPRAPPLFLSEVERCPFIVHFFFNFRIRLTKHCSYYLYVLCVLVSSIQSSGRRFRLAPFAAPSFLFILFGLACLFRSRGYD